MLVIGADSGRLSSLAVVVELSGTVLWAAWVWARWFGNSMTISGRTLTIRRGVLIRSCRVLPVEAVHVVTACRSVFGLLAGCGTVDIRFRAGRRELFSAVPAPDAVRDRILGAGAVLTALAPR